MGKLMFMVCSGSSIPMSTVRIRSTWRANAVAAKANVKTKIKNRAVNFFI